MSNNGLIKEEQEYLNKNLGLIDKEINKNKKIVLSYTNDDISTYKKIDESQYHNAIIKNTSYENMKNTPYFGKLDLVYQGENKSEVIYIGKKDLIVDNEVIIASWASPIADVYQGNTIGEFSHKSESENGKTLLINGKILEKRKLQIVKSIVKNVVRTGGTNKVEEKQAEEEFIKEKITSSDFSKLNSIVETIQEDQNEIIRLPIERNILVQGCAGSGKSSVAFHRLAYLMYKHKLKEEDVLVISPNKIFKSYTDSLVLELGNDFVVKNLLFTEFAQEILKKDYNIFDNKIQKNKELINNIKTSKNYKNLIDNYATYLLENHLDKKGIEFDDDIVVSYDDIQDIWLNNFAMYNINERVVKFKPYIKTYLEKKVNEYIDKQMKIYDSNAVKIKSQISNKKKCEELLSLNSEEKRIKKQRAELYLPEVLKGYLSSLKTVEISKVYRSLVSDEALLKEISKTCLRDFEVDALIDDMQTLKLDRIDSVCAFYLYTKLFDVKNKYRHIIIDECQDLSYLELAILENITRSFSIVGDFNQTVYGSKSIVTVDEIMEMFSSYTYFERYTLNKSFRNAKEITEFANAVMKPYFVDEKSIPQAFNRSSDKPTLYTMKTNAQIRVKLIELIKENKDSNLGIILKDEDEVLGLYEHIKSKILGVNINLITDADDKYVSGVNIISAKLSKGLEFDKVIVLNAEKYKDTKADRSLLYIAATRALNELTLIMLDEESFIKDIDKNLWKEIIRFVADSMCEGLRDTIISCIEQNIKTIPMEVMDFLNDINDANKLMEIIMYLNNMENIEMFYEKYQIKVNESKLVVNVNKPIINNVEKTQVNTKRSKDGTIIDFEKMEDGQTLLDLLDSREDENKESEYDIYVESILHEIRLKDKIMSAKQKLVTDYIYSNIDSITSIPTVIELARRVDVSTSTVTGVFTKLQLGSYKEIFIKMIDLKVKNSMEF